ncbi:oxidative stress-induced growth inhibitor 2 isoform X3 [Hemicordylus capensis]|nr:oxidative stress-induced growth inhibitor 2 isoform X3 [Hemicordylus capensis]
MPLLEESALPVDQPLTLPMVIIGNGPSGICLSYMLSGYRPYLSPEAKHPNPILHRKLKEAMHLSIVDQDLDYLSEGLEGRSSNPVAVLFDTLLHPDADFGFDYLPVLDWKLEPHHYIPHIVLGKGPPGGAWHSMEGSMLTISFGDWMELPGYTFKDWAATKRRAGQCQSYSKDSPGEQGTNQGQVTSQGQKKRSQVNAGGRHFRSTNKLRPEAKKSGLHRSKGSWVKSKQKSGARRSGLRRRRRVRNIKCDRVLPEEIASYYKHYVKVMGLQKNFRENTYITSVSRLYREQDHEEESQMNEDVSTQDLEMEDQSEQTTPIKRNWEIRGYQRAADGSHVPFCLFAENVTLATGTFDAPGRLQVEGEDFPFVLHSISDFGAAISKGLLHGKIDPVLIIGGGLTAADAVLCAYNHHFPIIHVFRRRVTDPNLIFRQLPKKIYPEYHKVYHMMCTHSVTKDSNLHPSYTSFPEHQVLSFQSDMKCVLQSASGLKKIIKFSVALVLIGSHPNLCFLKDQGQGLGHNANGPITCKGNPIEIDPYTYECTKEPNLFAVGPLVGDNFVRFLKGGALGISRHLAIMQKKHQLIVEGEDGVP